MSRRFTYRLAPLATLVLLTSPLAAQCPTVKRAQNYTDGLLTMTGWCEELAGEGEAALFATLPAADFPLQILRIGVGWRALVPGTTTSEAAIDLLGIDPLGMMSDPPALYSLPNPVLVDGQINVFDVSGAATPWIVNAQPFTVWVRSNGTSCDLGSVAHDNDGCTPNKNRFRAVSFPFFHQWYDSCAAVGGDAVIWVEYASQNDCPTGTLHCFGDGSGAPCPCANTGASGRGCENASTTGGGLLEAHGQASVSADSLQLRARFLPPGTATLFFQGTAQLPVGVVLGDGLRCTTGTLLRLKVGFATAGSLDFGAGVPGDPTVSGFGLVPPAGGVREYQAWYRDGGIFCTPDNSNVSNAVTITWTP